MPGGDAAARHPWRMAVSYLYKVLGNQGLSIAEALFPTRPVALISGLVKGGRCPLTASCGRLFDAVSALLGCEETHMKAGLRGIDGVGRGCHRTFGWYASL